MVPWPSSAEPKENLAPYVPVHDLLRKKRWTKDKDILCTGADDGWLLKTDQVSQNPNPITQQSLQIGGMNTPHIVQ